ncbi:MAG: hypothetical protein RL026_1011 [Pseudomonadota bacterium]
MTVIAFLFEVLSSLYLGALLYRLLLQWVRADFRSQAARGLVQVTNPVVLPLRRLLPAVWRVDTGTVVALLVLTALQVAVLQVLAGLAPLADPAVFALFCLRALIRLVLHVYLYSLIVHALLSLLGQGGHSPVQPLLAAVCNPLLRPFRRLPSPTGWDLSPLWAALAIQALLLLPPLR